MSLPSWLSQVFGPAIVLAAVIAVGVAEIVFRRRAARLWAAVYWLGRYKDPARAQGVGERIAVVSGILIIALGIWASVSWATTTGQ